VLFNTQDPGSTTIRYGLTSLLELGSLTDTAKATSHRTTLSGLQPATFYYVKAVSLKPNGDSSVTSPVLMSTASLSSGTIRVLFSRDVRNDLTTFTPAVYAPQSIDDTIIAYITRCKGTLDIAMYNWNNNSLSDITAAVNDAYDRGVKVRLVYDGGNANLGLGTLNPNIGKIASPQTSSYTIMHNKFMIVDANSTNPNDPFVFTGSTNWTNGQINSDANNQVIIQDQALARAYTIEFEEMFGSNGLNPNTSNARFGQFKTNNTPHQFMIGGKQVEQYFSPSDNVNQQLINAIKSANTDLCFQILTFTRRDVALAIAGRASAGVFAAGMIDDTANGSAGFFDMKAVMGGNVIKYAGPGLIHHKMAVADANNYYSDPLVLTGSHNWSNSADSRNDENTVIIHDAGIANQFFQEFAKQSGLYGIPTGWGFANFMVDSLTIRQNHQVSFTDLSVFNDVVPKASSHTWNFGDGQTSNLPAPKHAYANPGKYTVSLIAGNGTVTDTITQELLITVIPNTGVPQGAVAQNIRFFPNPVKTTGIIEADDAGAHSFIIYSILGQTMLSGRFTGELTIDASGFAPGVYLVSVDGVSGLKFIKE
jgi:phosphatidylserine/phosphatidylglycerophosphate/cardiolipin synthase-like enzyme